VEGLRFTAAEAGRAAEAAAERVQPVFYYDLGDPECYLAAERVMSELPVVPEWEPVQSGPLGARTLTAVDRGRFERRAAEAGIQPIRWPSRWPPDSRQAMLAATYAKRIGKGVAFSLAAFRQAFAGGRDLGDRDTILIAGAACEIHPSAPVKAIGLRSIAEALEQAGIRARAAGVSSLPAIQVGDEVFEGEDLLETAADLLAR
jgi:2-hydroxychromene-2-carboxylate isomerase